MQSLFDVPVSKKRELKECACGACKLREHSKTCFKGIVQGKGKKSVLLLTSHPEVCEDDAGEYWGTSTSNSSELLESFLKAIKKTDLDVRKDCWRISAVNCTPNGKNSKHTMESVDNCRPAVFEKIKELKPKVILAFGSAAIKCLYGHRTKDFPMMIDTWHGFVIPDFELGAWVIPCYDTLSLAQQRKFNLKEKAFRKKETYKLVEREISRVVQIAEKKSHDHRPQNYRELAEKHVAVLTSNEKILKVLESIKEGDVISFDYETSSTKPDYHNQFIKCVSLYVVSLNNSYSFLIDTRKIDYQKIRDKFSAILKDKTIKKIGQNVKHEERWSRAKLGTKVRGWIWDTMLVSHCLYNSRKSATGLKFQVLVNFGVCEYNGQVESYFSQASGNIGLGDNQINCIDAINEDELLRYCALDSIFTYWLYLAQKRVLEKWENSIPYAASHIQGARFLLDSIITFADMEEAGAFIDTEYLSKQKKWCDSEIIKLEKEFRATELFKKWRQTTPNVNLNSNKQLSNLLYGVMGLKQKKKTENGEDSTDKEALLSLGLPDLATFFRMKLLQKATGTYIRQLQREMYKGFIHASFNLNVAATFRSSSNSPNLQNTPIRNKDIGIIIRGAYKSRYGKKGVLIEADLKGAEVSTAACYNKDPNFIKYVADPKNDMHKDTMALIMDSESGDVTKELRHVAKNKFVFPEFYGDWFGSCAEAIWAEIQKLNMSDGTPAVLHLQNRDIIKLPLSWKPGDFIIPELHPKTYEAFHDHLGEVEHKFWYEMFPVYTEWKEEWWQKYLGKGYVESFTGFRYTGIMDKKKTINYPIQGDAYHLSQTGVNKINRSLRKEKVQACVFNQIHDSVLFDTTEDVFRDVIKLHLKLMNGLKDELKWINVPIVVEYDVTEPGESWFNKKPFDVSTMEFVKK